MLGLQRMTCLFRFKIFSRSLTDLGKIGFFFWKTWILRAFWRCTSLTKLHHKSLLQRNSNSCAFGMTTLGIGATLSSRTWPQIVNSDRKRDLFTGVLIGLFLGIWWKPRCSERSHIFLRTKRLYDLYVWWSLIDFHSVGCARAFPVKPYAQVFAPRSPRLCVSSWFGLHDTT